MMITSLMKVPGSCDGVRKFNGELEDLTRTWSAVSKNAFFEYLFGVNTVRNLSGRRNGKQRGKATRHRSALLSL